MMCLSFSDEFFFGTTDIYEIEPSDRPTSVLQAIISLDKKTRVQIARDILKEPHPVLYSQSEEFDFAILDKVRETDLCDGAESPVVVYVDPEQAFSLTIYEE
jgi:hypothetical protein